MGLRVSLERDAANRGPGVDRLATALQLAADRADDLVKLRSYVNEEVTAQACHGQVAVEHGRRWRARPCGYWLAAEAQAAADRLRLLGVEVIQLVEPASVLGSLYRQQPGGAVELLDALVDMPTASYIVPMSQARGNVAAAALEPENGQAFLDQGVLADLSQVARLRVPFAPDGASPAERDKLP